MFNDKLDLFGQSWLDTVFAGRNKAYGAYDLRRRDAGITVKSTIIGAIIFSLLISAPLIVKRISATIGIKKEALTDKITLVDLTTLPPPPKEEVFTPPPPPVKEVQSIQDIKKFTQLVVADESEVVEVVEKVSDIKRSGAREIVGQEGGDVVIEGVAVEHDVINQTEGDGNEIFETKFVQVMPQFKQGGEKGFIQWIAQRLAGSIQLDSNQELNMKFRFVIEKDGSLSDIETVSDGGYPAIAQQAIRVLEKSPAWKPGINNGKPVRVSYMVPIIVKPSN